MKKLLILAALSLIIHGSSAQIITTIAGTGSFGYTGDGGLGIEAQIQNPGAMAVDGNGNAYFVQTSNYVIRRVDVTGIITTFAGNGTQGFSGDGGPATSASLSVPGGLATDNAGNLYIADGGNNRVRKVAIATGIISTVVDFGPLLWPKDVVVDGSGNLYVAFNHIVKKVDAGTGAISTIAGTGLSGESGDGGPATLATLQGVSSIALNNNNLFLAQLGRVRLVDLTTGLISTVAGGGTSTLENVPATTAILAPTGIAVDGGGNLYLATHTGGLGKIKKVSGGLITTFAGGLTYIGEYGPAIAANIGIPIDVNVDNNGNVYLGDYTNRRIRKVWPCISSVTPTTAQIRRICQNAASPLTVTTSGTGTFTYQWYSNTTSSQAGATLIPGATGASYVPPSALIGYKAYFAKINGSCGPLALPFFHVYVDPPIVITSHPSTTPQTMCMGDVFTPLSVVSTGTSLTYTWYYNLTNSNVGGTMIGQLNPTSTYYVPSGWIGTRYFYVKISGCTTVYSQPSGPITVNGPTTITTQPNTGSYTVCQPQTAVPLSVVATGGNLTYQWYRNTTSSNWVGGQVISGATASSHTPADLGSFFYYVVVSSSCGPSVTSSVSGMYTIKPPTVFTTQPSSSPQTVCQNAAITPLTVAATGPGTLTYQWYSNTTANTSGGTFVGGGTSYTPPSTTAGTKYYYATVTGECGPKASSVSGAITIIPTTTITAQPSASPQTVCLSGTFNSLTVTATGTSLSYQWYSNTTSSNSGGSPIGGATGTSYTPQSTTVGTRYYYVIVTGTCGTVTSSVSGAITTHAPTVITVQPSSTPQTVCQPGTLTSLYVAASGQGTLTYQWYSNTAPSTSGGTVISGATGSSYTPPSTTVGVKYFYVIVTGGCGSLTSSVSGAIIVNPIPVATISGNSSICPGDFVTLTSSPGSYYSWSTGQQGPAVQSIDVTSAATYYVTVTNSYGCSTLSAGFTTTVLPNAPGTITQNGSMCFGDVQLWAGDGSDWTWGSQYMYATYAGTFSVSYRNIYGCWVYAETVVEWCPSGGGGYRKATKESDKSDKEIPPFDQDYKFGIYPNPAREQILIVLSEPAKQDCPVQIYDQLGRLSGSTVIEEGLKSKSISIADLQAGFYIVNIKDNQKYRQQKLIVSRE